MHQSSQKPSNALPERLDGVQRALSEALMTLQAVHIFFFGNNLPAKEETNISPDCFEQALLQTYNTARDLRDTTQDLHARLTGKNA